MRQYLVILVIVLLLILFLLKVNKNNAERYGVENKRAC